MNLRTPTSGTPVTFSTSHHSGTASVTSLVNSPIALSPSPVAGDVTSQRRSSPAKSHCSEIGQLRSAPQSRPGCPFSARNHAVLKQRSTAAGDGHFFRPVHREFDLAGSSLAWNITGPGRGLSGCRGRQYSLVTTAGSVGQDHAPCFRFALGFNNPAPRPAAGTKPAGPRHAISTVHGQSSSLAS